MAGSYTVVNKISEAMDKIEEEQKKRAKEVALEAESDVKEVLSGEGNYREYTVPGTGKTYMASAPGEPPAVRTGELLGSISHELDKILGGYSAVIGTPKDYGAYLEFGTRHMAARPFLRPTLKKNDDKYQKMFGGRWF